MRERTLILTYLLATQSLALPCDNLLLEVQNFRMNFTRELLMHIGGLLNIRGDQVLCDGVLDLLLDERRYRRRERARDVVRDIGP